MQQKKQGKGRGFSAFVPRGVVADVFVVRVVTRGSKRYQEGRSLWLINEGFVRQTGEGILDVRHFSFNRGRGIIKRCRN